MKRNLILALIVFLFIIEIFSGESGNMLLKRINTESDWAETHIQKAYVKDISPDIEIRQHFKGKQPLTRGEFAVLISRVLPCDIKGYTDYTEEYNSVRFYKEQAPKGFTDFRYWDSFGYVERVTKRGIMNPVKGKFNPHEKISRGEFLKTLLILLEKTDDPFSRIDDIACDALKLNRHLTGFIDVSVTPGDYPGWVKMAQEYNILPSRDDNDDFLTSRIAIPYKEVFYNYSTRRYEFQPELPISRELALSVFSNLFVKWDGFGDFIPFDVPIGNTSSDITLKTVDGSTKVDCELLDIDTVKNEIMVSFQERKTEFRNGKIFNTVFVPGKEKYRIADNAYLWVVLNGKVLKVRGDDPVKKLDTVISKLKDDNIFDIRLNFLLVPEKHKYNSDKKVLIKENGRYEKRKLIGYMEVNLIPYDYVGRIIARSDNTITMFDKVKGNMTFDIDKDVQIVREVIGVDGKTGLLTDKMVNTSDVANIKEGEEVKIKLDRDGEVKTVVSRLMRIGVPSNIDVTENILKTQHIALKHYKGHPQQWDPDSRTGLVVYGFDFDYPGKWRRGGLDILFKNSSSLRRVDLYVQPADVYPVEDSDVAKEENRIFFIESVPKYF